MVFALSQKSLDSSYFFRNRQSHALSKLVWILKVIDRYLAGPPDFLHRSWSVHAEKPAEVALQARSPDCILDCEKHAVRQNQRWFSNFFRRKQIVGIFMDVGYIAGEEMNVHLQRNRGHCWRLIAPGIVGIEASLLWPFRFKYELFRQQIADALHKSAFHLANINLRIQAHSPV